MYRTASGVTHSPTHLFPPVRRRDPREGPLHDSAAVGPIGHDRCPVTSVAVREQMALEALVPSTVPESLPAISQEHSESQRIHPVDSLDGRDLWRQLLPSQLLGDESSLCAVVGASDS